MGVYDDIKTGLEQAIAYESNALLTGNVDYKDTKGLNVKNMKNKCRYYRTKQTVSYTYHPITGEPISHDVVVGVCTGTRETDECKCGGNETQCDFYPEVRERGIKNSSISIQDAINHFKYGISHDIFQEPVTTYAKLAVKALEKQLKEE